MAMLVAVPVISIVGHSDQTVLVRDSKKRDPAFWKQMMVFLVSAKVP